MPQKWKKQYRKIIHRDEKFQNDRILEGIAIFFIACFLIFIFIKIEFF